MRGFPLLRFVLVALGLCVAGFPVWSLTRPAPPAVPQTPVRTDAEHREVELVVNTSTPALVRISSPDGAILETVTPTSSASARFAQNASAPDDLVVSARWEAGGEQALRVRIIQNEETLLDRTLWAEGELEDVIGFQP
ncbi:MAG: hypothetical protein SFU53_10440 [Terrimicrobiaceae bacterium]|nr:hypothetical protein [Terrimicrobiaceae bacterium]